MIASKSKQAALLNARGRSKAGVRRTSQSSTANPQSEVTKKPPQIYRLDKMNIPVDLAGMTRMVHGELQKIETSQSAMLSLWQQIQGMGGGTVETVNDVPPDDSGNVQLTDLQLDTLGVTSITNTPEIEGEVGWNLIPSKPQGGGSDFDAVPWGLCGMSRPTSNAPEGWNGYGDCFTLPLQGTHGFKTIADYIAGMATGNAWIVQFALDTSGTIAIRTMVNALPWKPWVKLATAADEVALAKAEIYAELARLNPGLVIPPQ